VNKLAEISEMPKEEENVTNDLFEELARAEESEEEEKGKVVEDDSDEEDDDAAMRY
jgi:hypothetical protein